VKSVSCLRPISLVAGMAHVIDGLWLQKNRQALETFAGIAGLGQVSGTSSCQLLLLAILFLAQLRNYMELPRLAIVSCYP